MVTEDCRFLLTSKPEDSLFSTITVMIFFLVNFNILKYESITKSNTVN